MAASGFVASISTRRIHRSSSVGRMTGRSACGMLTVARSSRSSRATGNRIFAKSCEFSIGWLDASPAQRGRGVEQLPERGRGVEQLPVKLTFETMAAIGFVASISTRRIHRSSSVGLMTRRSACGMLTVARSSRSSRATGNYILRSHLKIRLPCRKRVVDHLRVPTHGVRHAPCSPPPRPPARARAGSSANACEARPHALPVWPAATRRLLHGTNAIANPRKRERGRRHARLRTHSSVHSVF